MEPLNLKWIGAYLVIGLVLQFVYVRWIDDGKDDLPPVAVTLLWPFGLIFLAFVGGYFALTWPGALAKKSKERAEEMARAQKNEATREAGQLSVPDATGGELCLLDEGWPLDEGWL